MQKLASVVMSVYNEPFCYIEQAVDSIIGQTYPSIEIIVVVDNPKNVELVGRIIEKYGDVEMLALTMPMGIILREWMQMILVFLSVYPRK